MINTDTIASGKISLQQISTEDLINELKSRDLLNELSEEKQEWLKGEEYFQITGLQFCPHDRNKDLYSLKYLKELSLDTIKKKAEMSKKRQSIGVDRLDEN